jgi:hypothetical protein
MTTTTTTLNGRERKSLAQQLDRLDSILDGLADALNEAVAQAVQDAVGHAVREAVQATLAEVLTHPDVLQLLRGPAVPPAPESVPVAAPAPRRPGLLKRLLGRLGRGLGACRDRIATWLGVCQDGIGGAVGQLRRPLSLAWRLRAPLAVAVAAGTLIGLGAYTAGPVVAALVSGVAGFAATVTGLLAAPLWRLLTSLDHLGN